MRTLTHGDTGGGGVGAAMSDMLTKIHKLSESDDDLYVGIREEVESPPPPAPIARCPSVSTEHNTTTVPELPSRRLKPQNSVTPSPSSGSTNPPPLPPPTGSSVDGSSPSTTGEGGGGGDSPPPPPLPKKMGRSMSNPHSTTTGGPMT